MELFLPSIFLFAITAVISFAIIPQFSPMILVILALGFLIFGVYHHYKLFKDEYRLSTWQENIKMFAPAILITAIIAIMLFAITFLFSGSRVPVPIIPTMELPTANTATNALTSSLNKVMNATSDVVNTVKNTIQPARDAITNTLNQQIKNTATVTSNMGQPTNALFKCANNGNKANMKNLTRSFLEVI